MCVKQCQCKMYMVMVKEYVLASSLNIKGCVRVSVCVCVTSSPKSLSLVVRIEHLNAPSQCSGIDGDGETIQPVVQPGLRQQEARGGHTEGGHGGGHSQVV